MSFRTIVIKSRCKLEYSLNYLVFRTEEIKRINLDEISSIIIQSTQVSITSALISELINHKIKIIFCDSKSNPQGEVVPYYSSYNTKEKITNQLNISKNECDIVWKSIVEKKIENQKINLDFKNLTAASEKLYNYLQNVDFGDATNREGHAAKVYFNALFGKDFSRDKENDVNMYLDYGYSIILSCINREIKNIGYLTEIGIHHIGDTNPFNLSCDLMEPLRPLIDYYVISEKVNVDNFKIVLIDILNLQVICNNKKMILENAIKEYIHSVFNALFTGDVSIIKYINYERL